MLAPGGTRNAREERRRRGDERRPRKSVKPTAPELTLAQAMNAGKWELLLWLQARAKASEQE